MSSISVVVTCHDLGRTLGEALDSVRRQSRPAAELTVVDDGSTDLYTRQALARLDNDGVRVVCAERRGAAAARNLGAARTSGEYLVHLDADDILEPDYLDATAACLDADAELDFVSTAMRGFGESSYLWTPTALDVVTAACTGAVPHVSTMLRRRMWVEVGGYDEEQPAYEVLDFWTTVFERGFRGTVLSEPLLRYRVRAESRYHQAIRSRAHRAALARYYDKHRAAVEARGPEILVGKEAFILAQKDHQRHLAGRLAAAEAERGALRAQIETAVRELAAHGSSRVDWGELRRAAPVSPVWGTDRGKPVNRHYVESFLASHRADVRGHVLEVKDAGYTRLFDSGVTRSDVLDLDAANPEATIVADLTQTGSLDENRFDCFILTQVLNVNYDVRAVLAQAFRALKPGGVLLCTVAAQDRVSYEDRDGDGDFWRFTEASLRELLAEVFPVEAFEVTTYGNVLACAGHLYGLAAEELTPEELDARDRHFPLIVAARAVKPGGPRVEAAGSREPGGAILFYHRVARLSPDPRGLCVAPETFGSHMERLARDFRPIGLRELAEAARSGSLPPRAVAVTLDDGYLDALTAASPVLLDLGIPATFFVTTDRLDEEHELFWDTLDRLVLDTPSAPDTLELDVDGVPLRLVTRTAAQREAARRQLNERAYPMSAASRGRLLADLAAWSRAEAAPRVTHRVLTSREVRDLAERPGHTIGAHSVHHLALPHHPADVQRGEVTDSKTRLEALLGRSLEVFGYPYGEHSPATVDVVRAAGFGVAVTCEQDAVRPGADQLRLPRLEIGDWPAEEFVRRLDGCLTARSGGR